MNSTTVVSKYDEVIPTDEKAVVVAKIIAASCLFLISVVCGIIPFKLAQIFKWTQPIDPNGKDDTKSSKVVSVLLCFGGGVLLATTFLHLLPEIGNEIAILQEEGAIPELHFHIAEVLMMCGFFLIYLIEELVHSYLHKYQKKMKKKSEMSLTMKPEEESFAEAFMRGISARNSVHRRFSDSNGCIHTRSQRGSIIDLDTISEKQIAVISRPEKPKAMSTADKNHTHQGQGHHGHSHAALPIPHTEDEDMLVSSLRGLLIVLALSIHELFEGFAVGLAKTETAVYYLFAAVCAHKFVISFCIGVELMVQKTKLWLAFVYVIVYSIVSAIGILVGGILTTGSLGESLRVPNVILQGFATGTLLYVIFCEVLKDRSGLLPFASVLGGFFLMFGLQYIAGITESMGM